MIDRLRPLTKGSTWGYMCAMWPDRVWARLDCRSGGSHRMRKPVRFTRNSSKFLSMCRYCEHSTVMEFNENEGKIEEYIYKPSITSNAL